MVKFLYLNLFSIYFSPQKKNFITVFFFFEEKKNLISI